VVVARFDTDTLDEVIDVLDLFYRDRRPGSGLPVMSRTGRQLTVRWFAGTGHDNYLHVLADVDGRYVLGPQIWPWILSGEEIPGHDPTCLRGGTRRSWNGCPRPGSPPPTPTSPAIGCRWSAQPSRCRTPADRRSSHPTAPTAVSCGCPHPATP
jgi:hypothetical protein